MSRFLLDDETMDRITNEVPDLESLGRTVMSLAPDFISMKYSPQSNVPVAAVCLQDTMYTLYQVRIGLRECFEHRIWYREKCDPPQEELAVIFARYYIDTIVSQLYAAGEHIANAIIFMLDLMDAQLKKYRDHRTSQQSIVGNYLAGEQPKNPITKAVLNLANAVEWQKTMSYRGNWVHAQPPTVSGLGAVYKRQKRWVTSDDGKRSTLAIGTGDEVDFSIDDILGFVQPAVFLFVNVFEQVVSVYVNMLEKRGITRDDDGFHVHLWWKATGA